jgi:DNA polymerase/3'-5' exonuclease PolX
MSIVNFAIPSDSKILEDLNNNLIEVKFIGSASVIQNIGETIFTRVIQFNNDNVVKRVIYKKKGISWGFEALEVVNL